MIKNKFSFYSFIFFLVVCFYQGKTVFAEQDQTRTTLPPLQSGYTLCKEVSKIIEETQIQYKEIPLVISENNNFPFTISAEIPSNITDGRKKNKNQITDLLLVFRTEDIFQEKEFIIGLIEKIKQKDRGCNTKIIFSFGDFSIFDEPHKITGTERFIETQIEKGTSCAVCVSFSSGLSHIIPGGAKLTSPFYLIKWIGNAFFENSIFYYINGNFISSLYRLDILKQDATTSKFLENEIPAAGIILREDFIKNGKAADFLSSLTGQFQKEQTEIWDSHTTQIVIGTKIFYFSERLTTILYFIVSFLVLFFVCEFSLFFKKNKKNIRNNIIKIIYIIPLTVFITILAFFIGQNIALFFSKLILLDTYSMLAIKLFFGFLISSTCFLVIIKFQGTNISITYSYLLNITGILNIFIFSCVDISLFFLFTIECLIIFISRASKSIYYLAIFFLILLVPYIPYALQIFQYADIQKISKIVDSPLFLNIIFALAFLPFEFIWFEILILLNQQWTKIDSSTKKFIKQNILAISISVTIFTVILIIITFVIPDKYKKTNEKEKTKYSTEENSPIINLKYEDNHYFGETSRTIYIDLNKQCYSCAITIIGESENVILYSDDYFINEENKSYFRLPILPPQNIQFSFIANTNTNSTLTIDAMIQNDDYNGENEAYTLCSKTLFMPAINLQANEKNKKIEGKK